MNIKLKKILKIIAWIVAVAVIVFLIINAVINQDKVLCERIIVNNDKEVAYKFTSNDKILKALEGSIGVMVGKKIDDLNLYNIKNVLLQNPYIKNVSVVKTINGEIFISFDERIPLVRVFTKKGESFYIDDTGMLMPISPDFTSNTLIAQGEISESFKSFADIEKDSLKFPVLRKIYITSSFLSKNDFWHSMIDQIVINSDGDIELVPKTGKHSIIIGGVDNLENKFERLLTIYQKVIIKLGWNYYEKINLKFNKQIVCKKYKTE